MKSFAAYITAFLAAGVSAHMEMNSPAPLGSQFNPNTASPDYNLKSPLDPSGSTFPCGGKLNLLGTPSGKPVVTYAPGSSHTATILGEASHNGGSCQISLSVDGGKTWKVIQSVMGGCPLNKNIPFTLPTDTPEGDAVLAWSWTNNTGNREFYMNCAAVTIGGGGSKRGVEMEEDDEEEEEEVSELARRQGSFNSLPDIFVANLETNPACTVQEGVDVQYPNPGPNAISNGNKLGAPSSGCGASSAPNPGAGAGSGNGAGNGNGNGNGNDSPAPSSKAPVDSIPTRGGIFAPAPTTIQTVTTSAAAQPTPDPAAGNGGNNGGSAPTSTTTSAPASKPTEGAGSGSGSGSGATNPGNTQGPTQAVGTPCATEGVWNCISGSSFQRCASGQWSQVMQLAAGMICEAGESDTISMKANSKVRRYSPGRRVRWA